MAQMISIAPFLSVRRGAQAVEFYKQAFGATELHRIESPDGDVVCQLSVDGATFWVSDESPAHANFSPESLGGGTVRMILTVPDPDAAFAPSRRGRREGNHGRGERVRMARRPRGRPVRPSLGDRPAAGGVDGTVMTIATILETALYVENLHRSIEFYDRVLGLKPASEHSARLCALDVAPDQVLLLFTKGGSVRRRSRQAG